MKRICSQIIVILLAICILPVFMASCASIKSLIGDGVGLQNSKEQGAGDKDKEAIANSGKTETIMPGLEGESQAESFHVLPAQMGKFGEAIPAIDVQNREIVPAALTYTIHKATLFANSEEAGLEQSAMNPFIEPCFLDENGKIKSSVKFLTVDLTVKNVRALPDRNITEFDFFYAASSQAAADQGADFELLNLPYPSYFSNPTGVRVGDSWQEYYEYRLSVGQSKALKVGWYVDLEAWDQSKLYLIFNYYQEEYRKLVKLEF